MKKIFWATVLAMIFSAGILQAQEKSAEMVRNAFRYYEDGKYEEALKVSNEALSNNPGDLKLMHLRAKIFLALKKWDNAVHDSQNLLNRDADFKEAHVTLGQAYLGKGDYKMALRHLEKAVQAGVEFPYVYHDLAVIYAYGKDYEKALREAQKALAKDPGYVEAYYAVGRFYMETERYKEAPPYFQKALDLNPDFEKAKELLALCYLELGNVNRAKDLARELLEENSQNSTALNVLQEIQKRKGIHHFK